MFSRFFIARPIFAAVLSILITLGGGVALFTLPVAQYPDIAPPTIEVTLNGTLLERFAASTPEVEKSWTVEERDGAPNDLRITTSAVVVPARTHAGGDGRELGLKLLAITWQPANR